MTQPPYAGAPVPQEGHGAPAYCYQHRDRATGVSCARCERPICPDCMHPASVGFQCPECVAEGRASVRQPSAMRTAVARSRVQPVVTLTLIALNVAMYLVTAALAGSLNNNQSSALFRDLVMFGPLFEAGQPWRLLTATFLHYGLVHVAVNMVSLWILGGNVEQALGRWRFLTVYLIAGLGGSLAAYLMTPMSAVAGASGSVFGLLGAAAVMMIRNRANLQPLIGILALNLVISFMPGISLAAHVGGFFTGAAATFLLLRLRR